MRQFRPPVGRVLQTARQETESPEAKAARLERMRFYSSRRWRTAAKLFLARNPICCWCGRLSNMVDHIIPRLTRPDLAFDEANLRACCRRCHSKQGDKANTPR